MHFAKVLLHILQGLTEYLSLCEVSSLYKDCYYYYYSFCLENGVMMILKHRLLMLIFTCLCFKKSLSIKIIIIIIIFCSTD